MWDFTPPHLPTLFILHITCTENQTSLLCVRLSVCRTSTAHTWQALNKRRERASRHSRWFLPLGLICRRSSVSLQGWIITCTALTQFFCSAGMDGPPFIWSGPQLAHHPPGSHGKLSFGCPKLVLGFNSCLFEQWLSYLLPGAATPAPY